MSRRPRSKAMFNNSYERKYLLMLCVVAGFAFIATGLTICFVSDTLVSFWGIHVRALIGTGIIFTCAIMVMVAQKKIGPPHHEPSVSAGIVVLKKYRLRKYASMPNAGATMALPIATKKIMIPSHTWFSMGSNLNFLRSSAPMIACAVWAIGKIISTKGWTLPA